VLLGTAATDGLVFWDRGKGWSGRTEGGRTEGATASLAERATMSSLLKLDDDEEEVVAVMVVKKMRKMMMGKTRIGPLGLEGTEEGQRELGMAAANLTIK